MGKRSRVQRRARRKARRANRKLRRAEKKAAKGRVRRARRLRRRAARLQRRSAELRGKIDNKVVRGLMADVAGANSLGNITVHAYWNYTASDLAAFDGLRVTVATSSPFRSIKTQRDVGVNETSCDVGPTKNFRYVVKLFGLINGREAFLDRTYVRKLRT